MYSCGRATAEIDSDSRDGTATVEIDRDGTATAETEQRQQR
jgi:hypothetical protein